jgi:hypothetical protein
LQQLRGLDKPFCNAKIPEIPRMCPSALRLRTVLPDL